ncbi:hypothetical protein [Mesorhizobium japonicum]|nr:hypothetical protein [Mesorhizobium japonicum]
MSRSTCQGKKVEQRLSVLQSIVYKRHQSLDWDVRLQGEMEHEMQHSLTSKMAYGFTITLIALSIISFFLLTPLGHWQADEFHFGYVYRTDGVNALLQELTGWAPRPFSELISYLYHHTVEVTGKRHIGALLITHWLAMIAAALGPILFQRTSSDRTVPLLLASALVLLSVVGRDNSEVFYWVQAALPNMPTLAAVFFVASVFLFTDRPIYQKAWLAVGALIIGALSSEIGATFAWIMSFLMISYWALYRRRFIPVTGSVAAIFVPALIVSGLVFYYLMMGRLSMSAEASAGSATARVFSSSVLATVKQFVVDSLFYGNNVVSSLGQRSHNKLIYIGILPKLAFLTCSFLYFRTLRAAPGDRMLAAVLFLSSAGAAFFVLFITYYQFGGGCCSRHATMEQALLWVAILAAGRFLATFFSFSPATNARYRAICVAALLSVVPSILLTARPLAINYSRFVEIRTKNDYIWDHRFDAGSTIVLKKYQPGEITGGGELYFQEGLYEKGDRKLPSAWAADLFMKYFGKDKLKVDGS